MEYIDNTKSSSFSSIIEVPFDKWLRGEKAFKTGFMYISKPESFDIFGFLLVKAGYTKKSLTGMRVPSQFAQVAHGSNQYMANPAKFLTTSGHCDTSECIALGKINDNPEIDDFTRQTEIAKILKTAKIGVRFCEKIAEPLSSTEIRTMLVNLLSANMALSDEYGKVYRTLVTNNYKILYFTAKDKTVWMVYRDTGDGLTVPFSTVTSANDMHTKSLCSSSIAGRNSEWFKAGYNDGYLSPECVEFLTQLRSENRLR